MIPLETTILYAVDSYPNRYWTAQRNTTEWSVFMNELTTSGNAIAKLMLEALAPKLHGAHLGELAFTPFSISEAVTHLVLIGLFDSHSLFADMIARSQVFLNGTAPLNVIGAAHACVYQLNESTRDPGVCTDVRSRDGPGQLPLVSLLPVRVSVGRAGAV